MRAVQGASMPSCEQLPSAPPLSREKTEMSAYLSSARPWVCCRRRRLQALWAVASAKEGAEKCAVVYVYIHQQAAAQLAWLMVCRAVSCLFAWLRCLAGAVAVLDWHCRGTNRCRDDSLPYQADYFLALHSTAARLPNICVLNGSVPLPFGTQPYPRWDPGVALAACRHSVAACLEQPTGTMVWRVEDRELEFAFSVPHMALPCFSVGGHFLAGAVAGSTVRVVDAHSGAPLCDIGLAQIAGRVPARQQACLCVCRLDWARPSSDRLHITASVSGGRLGDVLFSVMTF